MIKLTDIGDDRRYTCARLNSPSTAQAGGSGSKTGDDPAGFQAVWSSVFCREGLAAISAPPAPYATLVDHSSSL
jgi:hypothetical protein